MSSLHHTRLLFRNRLLGEKPIVFYFLSVIVFALTFFACQNDFHNSHEQSINAYFKALNAQDFRLISPLISDSLKTTEMGYILTHKKAGFYGQFQWDSVFQAKYQVREINFHSDSVELVVSKICRRISFLQDTALVYRVLFVFDGNQIAEISTTGYISMDFGLWQARRDSLVAWIDQAHPELNGFVYDLSPEGGVKYLKAIEIWRKEKSWD